MIGRVLKKNMPFFKRFGDGLEKHILHEFSDQMSTKSEVIRLTLYIHLISFNRQFGNKAFSK